MGPIIGWAVVAWFAGMMAADGSRDPSIKRLDVGSLCRPQCYMSGTFYDGVVRPMVPWPFRRGKYFKCARDGERDWCTGEIYFHGIWYPKENAAGPYKNTNIRLSVDDDHERAQ